MDIVLGVSMAPATIRMVLVEGENADGVTVDEDHFEVGDANQPTTLSAPDQVIAAIVGTREGASQGGHQLTSTGVTWTDPRDAAALAAALAARKIENVMLVSAFLAAAALAQTVGHAIGYKHIAMLFVEPDTATLAVVDSADGSITDVHRRPLLSANRMPELAAMIAGLDAPDTYANGLFIVGCGVDIAPMKPLLEAASYLPVSAPEEPDMALARGAALASANAPLFASSTAALAYAQDPGTGEVDPYAVSPGYLEVPVDRSGAEFGARGLAYSAAPDQEADAQTGVVDIADTAAKAASVPSQRRRPLLLAGSALAVVVVSAALALEVALALGIRPAVALRPAPGQALIAPAQAAPAPPAAQFLPAPHLPAVHVAPPPLHLAAPAPVAPRALVPAAPVPVPVPMHAGVPAPSMHVPGSRPLYRTPGPPFRIPPMREPFPQWRTPTPFRGSVPQPPMNFPTPGGSRFPEGPRFPDSPRFPESPRFPGGPRFPMMPGPMFPRMPEPMMPPAMPALPHFNFPVPSFPF